MPITDYNRKKALDVDSVSGTPGVDKAQPVIVRGESNPYEVANSIFNQSLDTSGEDSDPTGLAWNDTGSKLYIIGLGTDTIYEYDLSTNYDISTATFNQSLDISGEDAIPQDIFWDDTGSKLYMVGANTSSIYEYDLSTNYDISTATFNQSLDVSSQDSIPRDGDWNNDGSKLYMVGENNTVYEYNTSTNYDISTATFNQSLDVSSQDDATPGLAWNDTGSKLYVAGRNTDSIYEYNLSTNYDISTASLSDSFTFENTDVGATGIVWSDSGDAFFLTDVNNATVREYDSDIQESTTGNGDIVIDFANISDAQDIAVYDQNGNLLDYEIEDLDTTAETATLWCYNSWVRDGTVQAQVAYGSNSQNVDRQNVTGTWSNTGQNAEMVQHLQDDPLTATDSTSNNNDGTVNGAVSTSGEFGGAASFDGTDDYINGNMSFSFGDMTLVSWINPSNLTDTPYRYIWLGDTQGGTEASTEVFKTGLTGGEEHFLSIDDSSNNATILTGDTPSAGTSDLVIAAFDNSTDQVELSVDGSNVGSTSFAGTNNDVVYYNLGSEQDTTPGNDLNGILDAVRVYSDYKDNDWRQADYDASPKAGQVFFSQQAAEDTSQATTGVATGSASLDGDATATNRLSGVVNGSATLTGDATATQTINVKAQATGTATLNTDADMYKRVSVAGTGNATLNGEAIASVGNVVSASATATASLTGTASATKIVQPAATGTADLNTDATGTLKVQISADGQASFTADATGTSTELAQAQATGNASLTGTAIGTIPLVFRDEDYTVDITKSQEKTLSGDIDK